MSGRVDNSVSWWSRIFNGDAQSAAAQRQMRMEQQLADLGRQVEALRIAAEQSASSPDLTSLQEALLSLEKQVGRAGREQFKTNTIAEAQSAQLATALEQLRAADTRRAADLDALREQHRRELNATRLTSAQNMLPALDGLDEALRAGRQLLANAAQSAANAESIAQATVKPEPSGWLRQLFGEPPPAPAAPQHNAAAQQLAELSSAIDAWVTGLTFVRQRLLDLLAAADVWPIAAAGQPFDPQQQIAISVAAANEQHPAGTVVEELRRGYMAGERVLRHAEVVVAASAEQRLEEKKER